MGAPPPLERLLRRQQAITLGALGVLCLLAWAYVASGAGMGMPARDMTTLSALPHRLAAHAGMAMDANAGAVVRGPGRWALVAAMWWTMMVAMMTPSAAPTILLFTRVHRSAPTADRPDAGALHGPAPVGAFAAGYFLAWLGFSLVATAAQQAALAAGLLSPLTLGSRAGWLSGSLLVATGLYQWSGFRQACLTHCRAPAAFLARHWRPGAAGAMRLGLLHGAYCLGCCWMLMGLLFVGGVMNLVWIAALSALVLAEKHLPGGRWIGRATGAVLVGWGLLVLLA